MTLEVVVEICSITLWCCDDAKSLLVDYYSLYIVVRFKLEKASQSGMSTFILHENIITFAVGTEIFLSGAKFFLCLEKLGSNSNSKLTSPSSLLVYT